MPKFVGLILAFLFVILLAFLTNGFISTQHAPDNSTPAGQQYNNLTQTTEVAYMGINGTILLLIIAVIVAAIFLIIWAVHR